MAEKDYSSDLVGKKNLKRVIRKSAYAAALRAVETGEDIEVPKVVHFWAGRNVELTPEHQEAWKHRFNQSLIILKESTCLNSLNQ